MAAPKKSRKKQPATMNARLLLKCYCCGEPLGDEIAIASASDTPERVFTLLPEHATRVDGVWEIVRRSARLAKGRLKRGMYE